jgi:hypothetical protein
MRLYIADRVSTLRGQRDFLGTMFVQQSPCRLVSSFYIDYKNGYLVSDTDTRIYLYIKLIKVFYDVLQRTL